MKTPVSRDPDDDKFIAVALAANCRIIISGDNDLLSITGYKDIEIINPNEFWKKYLK
ncbi:nucleic acid-binding protein [Rickettsiella grylli]|uniref:Nucleic acid-binding protein n=1 Tax=Rickettsiella grylli TaxID=59196 RepID=A8PMI0_9COXI|nr:nucleic acid-binding protein [Rickettsiella grylli]